MIHVSHSFIIDECDRGGVHTMSSGSSGSSVAVPEPSFCTMFCLISRMADGAYERKSDVYCNRVVVGH